MKSVEFLTEAEQNVAKKKIDQQLDSLSDQDLDNLLGILDESLEESRFTYDPFKVSAQGQNKQQEPKPAQQKQQSKPAPKVEPPKTEVRNYIDDLNNKEKETLKAVLQKEKQQRQQSGEKVSAPPKQSSELKKWLQVLLISASMGTIGAGIGAGINAYNDMVDKQEIAVRAEKNQLSDFSIKGIKFGMTPDQVREARKKTFLTIGGISGWQEIYHNNKLVKLYYPGGNDTNSEENWLDKLSKKYGEPKELMRSTDLGLMNKPYRWTIQDAHIDLVGPNVYIYDPVLNKQRNLDIKNKNQAEYNKQAKDF